jgi:hypothetical protein
MAPRKQQQKDQQHQQEAVSHQPRQQRQGWQHMVAGGAAGSSAVLLLHPFDVIKTRLQVGPLIAKHGEKVADHGIMQTQLLMLCMLGARLCEPCMIQNAVASIRKQLHRQTGTRTNTYCIALHKQQVQPHKHAA